MDSLSTSPIHENGLSNLAQPGVFEGLSDENQKCLIDALRGQEEKGGGILGKFLGNKKENAALNIAFMICILLAIIGLVLTALGQNFWNIIFTAIMTTVGYIFGRGSEK